jgi:hypothetical protein
MIKRSFRKIESVEPELLEAVVHENGGEPPDNFVESAEGGIVGLPDLEKDEKELLERIETLKRELIHETKEREARSPEGSDPPD